MAAGLPDFGHEVSTTFESNPSHPPPLRGLPPGKNEPIAHSFRFDVLPQYGHSIPPGSFSENKTHRSLAYAVIAVPSGTAGSAISRYAHCRQGRDEWFQTGNGLMPPVPARHTAYLRSYTFPGRAWPRSYPLHLEECNGHLSMYSLLDRSSFASGGTHRDSFPGRERRPLILHAFPEANDCTAAVLACE